MSHRIDQPNANLSPCRLLALLSPASPRTRARPRPACARLQSPICKIEEAILERSACVGCFVSAKYLSQPSQLATDLQSPCAQRRSGLNTLTASWGLPGPPSTPASGTRDDDSRKWGLIKIRWKWTARSSSGTPGGQSRITPGSALAGLPQHSGSCKRSTADEPGCWITWQPCLPDRIRRASPTRQKNFTKCPVVAIHVWSPVPRIFQAQLPVNRPRFQ